MAKRITFIQYVRVNGKTDNIYTKCTCKW